MIYIIKHREYNNSIPKDYIELGVGSLYKGKETAINDLNPYINELSGLYDIWKHTNDDIVGFVQYGKLLYYRGKPITIKKAEEILKNHDIIIAKHIKFKMNLYWQLKYMVEESDVLDEYINKISEKVPDFWQYLTTDTLNPSEMFVCNRELMEKYCEWIFPIIIPIAEDFAKRYKGTNVNQRLIGHLIERLFNYWIVKNNLKVYETELRRI